MTVCPVCGAAEPSIFYELRGVPAHSVLLLPSREAARAYPRGDIALGFCAECDFVGNTRFDPGLTEYRDRYESTQAFSPTFDAFHRGLAERLIERHDLRGKTVIEIGCGQGEFLALLCELGGNRGIGFDPAHDPDRAAAGDRVEIVGEVYSEAYADRAADLVCCKMTLEHIAEPARFAAMLRRATGGRPETLLFLQVPEATRILREAAFWDIYYEHCGYFGRGALRRLLQEAGFDTIDIRTGYDGQYLMVEARPARRSGAVRSGDRREGGMKPWVATFPERCAAARERWRQVLRGVWRDGRRVAIWGGGSKAVAFLTTLRIDEEVACVVDINPRKWGTFLPGTGHPVVPPAGLCEQRPDLVIVMNPIYRAEVRRQIGALGIEASLVAPAGPA